MSLTKFLKDIRYHQGNADKPVMTAQQLKELFDQAGVDIKEYINSTLTEELDSLLTQKADKSNIYTKSEVYSKAETDANYVKNNNITTIVYNGLDDSTEKYIELSDSFNEENIYVICAIYNNGFQSFWPYTDWSIQRLQHLDNSYDDKLTLILKGLHRDITVKMILMKIS